MAILQRTSFMKPAFGFYVGIVRLFWRFKTADMDRFACHGDTGTPTARITANTEKPGFVSFLGASLVLAVETWCGFSQICYPIVGWIAIDMIDLHRRPMPMHVQPCKTMCFVGNTIDDDVDVTSLRRMAGNRASLVPMPRCQTMEIPRFVAVPKFCHQSLNS